MKVQEIIGPQQLDEINLRHAAAAGIMGASLLGAANTARTPTAPPQKVTQAAVPAVKAEPPKEEIDPKTQALIEKIHHLYGADPAFIKDVIDLAKKYQKPGFPTDKDILAIIAVESEFDPDAESGLKHDPAVGLMQVRPGVWHMDADSLRDPETAIKVGSEVLHKYWRHLHGDREAALQAYNVGMTNFQQGEENANYVQKFYTRLKHLKV